MPTGSSGEPSEHQARLLELLDEFKRARDKLHQAQEDVKRIDDLGAKLGEPARQAKLQRQADQAELQIQARAAKPEDLERLGFGRVLNRLIHETPEQVEIEAHRKQRKAVEAEVQQLRVEVRQPWARLAVRNPLGVAEAALKEFDRLSPYSTPANVDAIIGLLDEVIPKSATPTPVRRSPAERIGGWCTARRESRRTLARKAGISPNTLKKIIEGKPVQGPKIAAVAEVLDCPYDDLLPE